ncbi:MAG: methyltransferase domain-containing protein [Cyclobacteriaceae bacterium]|nr:methyltransferase domain-containing protein [Cyclobacteriaceae bacterium]
MNINEARIQWENAAPGWAKWEDVISNGATLITDQMLKMVDATPGNRILDLASGAGSQTLIAAERVSPEGHVVANDISQTMLNHVIQNAKSKGIKNVSTLLGAVQELDIEPDSFDSAICRFALMLFANPGIALSNVRQVLKPNGKMGVIVFSTPEENPFFVKPMQILLRNAGKTPPSGAPGLFSLGVPEILEKLFTESGFVNVEINKQNIHFKLPPAEESLVMIQEAFGAYRAVISDSPEHVQRTAWAEVLDYLKSLETSQGISAPAEVLVASAQKPV